MQAELYFPPLVSTAQPSEMFYVDVGDCSCNIRFPWIAKEHSDVHQRYKANSVCCSTISLCHHLATCERGQHRASGITQIGVSTLKIKALNHMKIVHSWQSSYSSDPSSSMCMRAIGLEIEGDGSRVLPPEYSQDHRWNEEGNQKTPSCHHISPTQQNLQHGCLTGI